MDSRVVCTGCFGRKEVAPLGGILRKCAICEGLGHVFVPNELGETIDNIQKELRDKYEINRTLRRRGRRPRLIKEDK